MPFAPPPAARAADSARRFHPFVRHIIYRAPHAHDWRVFAEWLAATHTIAAAALERAQWHGGIYINRERCIDRALPAMLAADTLIDLYHHESEPERIPLTANAVLLEGPGFVAVNKPAWLTTQGTRASVRHCLEWELQQLTGIPTLMACHRLDRQTSGGVVFGTDSAATGRIMQRFAKQQVRKIYRAIVTPPPAHDTWTTEGYLVRDARALPQDKFMLVRTPGGAAKMSRTEFRVLARDSAYALIECTPHTGRTHQLRVHLAHHACPILGDTRYAAPALAAKTPHFRDVRIQLHAAELTIDRLDPQHAHTTITAPMPDDWAWGRS